MLEFVNKVKPSRVFYSIQGLVSGETTSYRKFNDAFSESIFLPQLADLCESITISDFMLPDSWLDDEDDDYDPPVEPSLLLEILSRKCKYLEIIGRDTKFSASEVENLVQVSRQFRFYQ